MRKDKATRSHDSLDDAMAKLLRMPALVEKTSISRSQIFVELSKPNSTFPKPVRRLRSHGLKAKWTAGSNRFAPRVSLRDAARFLST
jgi:hypothetical protein